MTAESVVNEIIEAAQETAELARDKAIAYSDQGVTAASGDFSPAPEIFPREPNILIPPFVNPTEDLGNEYRTEIANAFSDLDPKLTAGITGVGMGRSRGGSSRSTWTAPPLRASPSCA